MNKYLILDYDDELLKVDTNMSFESFSNCKMFKLKLRRYVDLNLSSYNNIVFKKDLNYIKFKNIINILQQDSEKRDYTFNVTNILKKYIATRELHINERSNVGLAIKKQSNEIINKFINFRNIVDKNMGRKLRDKQAWDSFFMSTMQKSANFSVPGSGKTASVLGVFTYLSSINLVDRIFMVGPKNSFGSWIEEFEKSYGQKKKLNLFNIQDYTSISEKNNAILYETVNKNLLLFNYESLNSILNQVKKIVDERTLLVFDEVHKVKNINGSRAKDALEISKNAKYIIAMTGTPIPNSYLDLKNILNILYSDEYDEYFGFTDPQLKNPTDQDMKEINNKIQPFFCRTTKKQLEVPEANDDIVINSKATNAENKIFNILLSKYSKNRLALIVRLLQLESNPKMILNAINYNGEDFSDILDISGDIEDIEYVDYSEEITSLINSINKTTKFIDCINQSMKLIEKKESIIIWCIFIDSINNLAHELRSKGVNVGTIYGSVSDEERQEVLKKFRNKEIDVLITNPHTLAESVSLHSICHNAIYFEYSYNLVHLLQSKDRIHRLGLSKNQYTQYYFLQTDFLTKNYDEYSLDKRIYERLIEKENIMLDAIDKDILENLGNIEDDLNLIFKDLEL